VKVPAIVSIILAAVSASLVLGNFAGISSSATNAMKTCCEADIADALALSLTKK
jgi:hypothetical protein